MAIKKISKGLSRGTQHGLFILRLTSALIRLPTQQPNEVGWLGGKSLGPKQRALVFAKGGSTRVDRRNEYFAEACICAYDRMLPEKGLNVSWFCIEVAYTLH